MTFVPLMTLSWACQDHDAARLKKYDHNNWYESHTLCIQVDKELESLMKILWVCHDHYFKNTLQSRSDIEKGKKSKRYINVKHSNTRKWNTFPHLIFNSCVIFSTWKNEGKNNVSNKQLQIKGHLHTKIFTKKYNTLCIFFKQSWSLHVF